MNSKPKTTSREIAVYASGDITPDLWLQQPTETTDEYTLFKQYRDMPRRTLRRMHGQDVTSINRLFHERNWAARCLAYDHMLETGAIQLTKEAVAATMTKAALANLKVVAQIFELAEHDIGVHVERSLEADFEKVPVMDPKILAKLLDWASANLSKMAGQPTETIRVEHSDRNRYDNLTFEEATQMHELEKKAAGKT